MRIDLFAVWFMSGLLSHQLEQKTVFKMASATSAALPDLQRVPGTAAYVAEANPS
jgi:hypothetical protein